MIVKQYAKNAQSLPEGCLNPSRSAACRNTALRPTLQQSGRIVANPILLAFIGPLQYSLYRFTSTHSKSLQAALIVIVDLPHPQLPFSFTAFLSAPASSK